MLLIDRSTSLRSFSINFKLSLEVSDLFSFNLKSEVFLFHPFVLSGCVFDLLLNFGNKRFRVLKHCFPWLLVSYNHDHVSFKLLLFLHHVLYFHADSLGTSSPKNSFGCCLSTASWWSISIFVVVYQNYCGYRIIVGVWNYSNLPYTCAFLSFFEEHWKVWKPSLFRQQPIF